MVSLLSVIEQNARKFVETFEWEEFYMQSLILSTQSLWLIK